MTDARSKAVPKPTRSRWTSFVGAFARGRAVRGLEEERNPRHRARVEHNKDTLLVHVSNEDGRGWTTIAIDRATREWAIAQPQPGARGRRRVRAALSEVDRTPTDAEDAHGTREPKRGSTCTQT